MKPKIVLPRMKNKGVRRREEPKRKGIDKLNDTLMGAKRSTIVKKKLLLLTTDVKN